MAYNGEDVSHENIIKNFPEIDNTRTGITPMTARFLVERGYKVSYFSHQKDLLGESLENKTEKDIELFKMKVLSLDPDSNIKQQWEQIIKYIESGGNFSTKEQTIKDIDGFVEGGIPVRVGVKPSILLDDPQYKFNHAIVIAGMRTDKYLINDPSPKSPKPYWVKKEKLLDAWRSNGSIMFVATKV